LLIRLTSKGILGGPTRAVKFDKSVGLKRVKSDSDEFSSAGFVEELVLQLGGLTQAENRTGIPRRTLQNWTGSVSEPPLTGVQTLIAAVGLPASNRRVQGVVASGSRKLGKERQSAPAKPSEHRPFAAPSHYIRRFDVHLSAGNGSFTDRASELSPVPFAEDFFGKKLTGRSASNMVIVDARGDSMIPVIGDGDLVMIDTSETQPHDAIYAISYADALFLNRVVKRPHHIDLISSNPDYPVERVDGVDIDYLEIIGRVVWVGRTMV
jgi:phage repressor protein C with HTH and peptisase S24 domain